MDRSVYPDEEVVEALDAVACVRLVRGKSGKVFEDRWGKLPTPSFVVLTPDGKQLGKTLTGGLEVGDFLFLLDWVADPEGEMPEIQPGGS